MIEFKKAKAFYHTHRSRLRSLFSPEEMTCLLKAKKPAEEMALFLAAKEAVFKSLPSRAGLGGFEKIKIVYGKNNRLSFELPSKASFKKETRNLTLSVLKTKKYVLATCHEKNLKCAGI